MDSEMITAAVGGFGVFILIIAVSLLSYNFYNKYFKDEKTVKAIVVKKEIVEPENEGDKKKYIVYFQTGGKVLSFNVSHYNFDHNYYKGQKGKLKYNGNNLIEFIQK